ncbi:hypothetical protein IAT40_001529 [Kwoniella sp. CBS 6097]
MSNQPRRAHPQPARPNIRYGNPPQSPALLSHSTITFLASWRGQLLVCTVVLIVGAIYFFIRDPIESWSRRRREKISRLREGELIRMEQKAEESEEKEDLGVSGAVGTGSLKVGARERGREKRKEGKKRGGSILRVNGAANGLDGNLGPPSSATTNTSSVESSPAPPISSSSSRNNTATSPNKLKRSLPATPIPNHKSPSIRIRKATDESNPSSQATPSSASVLATPSRNRPPPPIIVPRPPTNVSPTPLEPWEIPLPTSPMAGPSRVNGNGHEYLHSDDGIEGQEVSDEFDGASESAHSSRQDEIKEEKKKSDGFSIFPEEGYLPIQSSATTGPGSSKKKKRKAKTGQTNGETHFTSTPRPNLSKNEIAKEANGERDIVLEIQGNSSSSSSYTRPRHRHQRTSSIALLPNLSTDQLREIVEKRDETIDQLRAEIGTAKAEEAKAKEEAMRCKLNEDRAKSDYERAKKAGGRGEGDARRREAELQARLSQLQHMHNSLLNRLGTYETALRETGIILPPPPSPIPLHIPQSSPLPMPTSPFAPSPVPGRSASMGGFMSYPSPGMYPSPMLQPNPHYPVHPHAHSPTPYRRLSGLPNGFVATPGLEDGLNGPMTPGLTGYPMDIGSSTMPIGLGHPTSLGNGELSEERERRRQSIESSVLKKKVKEMSTIEGELKQSIEEEDVQADDRIPITTTSNGVGSRSGSGSGSKFGFGSESMSELNSSASNSHPSSPRSAASALRPLSNGDVPAVVETGAGAGADGLNASTSTSKTHVTASSSNGLRVVSDGERGNVYYARNDERIGASVMGEQANTINLDASQGSTATLPNGTSSNADIASDHQDGQGQAAFTDAAESEAAETKSFELEPIFASLAHTPEEVGHIKSQAEKYRERGRSISSLSAAGSGNGSGSGSGKAGFASLNPSPNKSPVPLRT